MTSEQTEEFRDSLNNEIEAFEQAMLSKDKKYIYDRAYMINAMESIYDNLYANCEHYEIDDFFEKPFIHSIYNFFMNSNYDLSSDDFYYLMEDYKEYKERWKSNKDEAVL